MLCTENVDAKLNVYLAVDDPVTAKDKVNEV